MSIELIRENIECEQLLGENMADTIVKGEYVIPDTHPDVVEILTVESKPVITNKEVQQDKVLVEGEVKHNVIYKAREDEKLGIHNVTYNNKFSNQIELKGAEHRMDCDVECYVEHMGCNILNERKVMVEGIVKLKAEVYKNNNFQIVKDVDGDKNVQMLKNTSKIDKIVGTIKGNLEADINLTVPADKPQIGNVLKTNINLKKKNINIMENKINVEANAVLCVLYRGKDTTDIACLEKEVVLNNEFEFDGINPLMEGFTEFNVEPVEIEVKEDETAENRVVEAKVNVKTSTKVLNKEQMDVLEDIYSPDAILNMKKENYELNDMVGNVNTETVVKGDIEIDKESPKPVEVIMASGNVCITDKKVMEEKVAVEGVVRAEVMYKVDDENKSVENIKEELPFSATVDISGCKLDMQAIAKALLENLEASIEAGNIAIKALIELNVRVNAPVNKEFLVELESVEDEVTKKKCSITIYIVQKEDTLWKIAKKYFTTMDDLMKMNGIDSPDMVKPGEKLLIPGRLVF